MLSVECEVLIVECDVFSVLITGLKSLGAISAAPFPEHRVQGFGGFDRMGQGLGGVPPKRSGSRTKTKPEQRSGEPGGAPTVNIDHHCKLYSYFVSSVEC